MQNDRQTFDAVIVGGGFAGLHALHALRSAGFKAVILESAPSVGGTWYWNRYPGARCDIPSFAYSYSFSEELQQEWEWSEVYAAQPEIERYINHVADRFDLRRDIRFETKVVNAEWSNDTKRWRLETDGGTEFDARICVMAVGGYSVPLLPQIDGLGTFGGETYYSSKWPTVPVSFAGKRVGVVGTGASGMQVIEAVSAEAVEHLYVFQRTANFCVPGRNRPLTGIEQAEAKRNYPAYREAARSSSFGAVFPVPAQPVAPMTDDEFDAYMGEVFQVGGVAVIAAVADLLVSEEANERVAEYVRRQVRKRIRDPRVAELICSYGHHIGTRRLLVENGYLDAFNQDHVSLIDIRERPISITKSGISSGGTHHDLDMIILATGFDSGTGGMLKVPFTGRDGLALAEHWKAGHRTFLGMMVAGFPNLFMIAGPGSPGIRAHGIVIAEQQVDWLTALLTHMREQQRVTIEPSVMAEAQWTDHVQAVANMTFVTRHDTQYVGANVPGKPRVYAAYLGGVGTYGRICDSIAAEDYTDGLVFDFASPALPDAPGWSGAAASAIGLGVDKPALI